CDSLVEGYVSEFWDFTCISVTQSSGRQSVLESCKCPNLFEEIDEYYRDERTMGCYVDQAKGG
ncbi:hypothetical protein Goshw_024054, partial [Gossypium schwendimanii]|nr:hypothetical protein [Gossypium schwendimanii]